MELLLRPAFRYFAAVLILFTFSCNAGDSRKNYSNSDRYDFANPKVLNLPEELDEISGLAYYPRDTSVFAIIDEDGILFKIPLKDPQNFKEWKFEKSKDYEDLVLIDTTFYVLVSNGNIVKVNFKGNKIITTKDEFHNDGSEKNEFEIVFNAMDSNNLVVMCKDCNADSKKTLSSYTYNYHDSISSFQKGRVYDMTTLTQKLGIEKHLKPSAAAINPITKDLYIVSSIQKLIVIMDKDGNFKDYYKLNPALYKQPEGIAFTPEGDLIISNEFADDGFATLLLMKNKLK